MAAKTVQTLTRLFLLGVFFCASASAETALMPAPGILNCRIVPSQVVEISSPVEGIIAEVLVERNDEVQAGETVAKLKTELETSTLALRKAQAEITSDIDARRLANAFAERTLKRITDLHNKKAASYSELDKAKTEYAITSQELQQAMDRQELAQLEYQRALADLSRRSLTSPISGIVVARYKQAGEHIDVEPVVKVAQINPLWVEAYAPASLYGRIKVGTNAKVEPQLGLDNKSYYAEVILVDRVIDAPSNTFAIRLKLDNSKQALPSGLKCNITFSDLNNNP